MPLKQSEAIVLRTYPFREADLIVTLFSRSDGKVKGVAKSAKRSRKRFGGALEPLTVVRAQWQDREGVELARVESCEVVRSPLGSGEPLDYPRLVALSHVAEMLDELLPEREPNDAVFRLASSVLAALASGEIWLPVAYFDLWMLRLLGFLPPMEECIDCGAPLAAGPAYFHALRDGLVCPAHRRIASSELTPESRALTARILRAPIERIAAGEVPANRAADLRKFLMQIIHRHFDRKLETATLLDRLG